MFREVVIQANISFSLGTIWSEPQWGNVSSSGDSSKYTHTGEPLFPTLAPGQGCLTTSVSQWVNFVTQSYQSKFDFDSNLIYICWFKLNVCVAFRLKEARSTDSLEQVAVGKPACSLLSSGEGSSTVVLCRFNLVAAALRVLTEPSSIWKICV